MNTSSKILSFMACGSAMYTRKVSTSKDPDFLKVVQKLKAADVSFMNFEGQIGHPDAYPLNLILLPHIFLVKNGLQKNMHGLDLT